MSQSFSMKRGRYYPQYFSMAEGWKIFIEQDWLDWPSLFSLTCVCQELVTARQRVLPSLCHAYRGLQQDVARVQCGWHTMCSILHGSTDSPIAVCICKDPRTENLSDLGVCSRTRCHYLAALAVYHGHIDLFRMYKQYFDRLSPMAQWYCYIAVAASRFGFLALPELKKTARREYVCLYAMADSVGTHLDWDFLD